MQIGSFFNGQSVTVSGTIPAGAQAVLEVMGSSAEEHLMRKGRRGGLWMNVGKIKVQDAPSLYLVMSTAKELLDGRAGGGHRGPSGPGEAHCLQRQNRTPGAPGVSEAISRTQGKRTYLFLPARGPQTGGRGPGEASPVTASFPLPTNIRPATYKVCLSVIADGKAVGNTCTDFTVEMVGFPALMAQLAYQHEGEASQRPA